MGTLNQPNPVFSLSFNATSNRVAVACQNDLREWDVPGQTLIRSLIRANNQISGTAFTPDSTKIVSSSYDGKVFVHDVATGAFLRQMVPGGNVFALATSVDTVAAAINVPNVIKLYRLSDGALLRTLVPSGSLTALSRSSKLTEVGFTCPPGSVTYWVGEAQGDKVYRELKTTPKAVAETTAMLASNAAHLARLLKSDTYPGMG